MSCPYPSDRSTCAEPRARAPAPNNQHPFFLVIQTNCKHPVPLRPQHLRQAAPQAPPLNRRPSSAAPHPAPLNRRPSSGAPQPAPLKRRPSTAAPQAAPLNRRPGDRRPAARRARRRSSQRA